MKTETMLQVTEPFPSRADAEQALDALRLQVGFAGGRLLYQDHTYTAQAFFPDDTPAGGWLPDGVRRVIVIESQRRALGFPD